MNGLYSSHPVTLLAIMAAMLMTPGYLFATFVFSGASARKGAILGAIWVAFCAVMTWVCLSDVPAKLGFAGNLIVPLAWITPSLLLVLCRGWVLAEPLSQRWLIGLQVWRSIGAVFIIEMARGSVPRVFAWPAGLGDVLVAIVALAVVLAFRARPIPGKVAWLVALLGFADFLSAFFFGFTSGEGPQNLFPQTRPSRLIEFPTGMIPLFLVPYAIFFHTLSLLNLRRSAFQPAPPGVPVAVRCV
jgi:hypothetical protein